MSDLVDEELVTLVKALIDKHIEGSRGIASTGGPYESILRVEYDKRLDAAARAVIEVFGQSARAVIEVFGQSARSTDGI